MPHVRTADEALAVVTLVRSSPLRAETLCFALDDAGLGRVVSVIDGTDRPDDIIDIVEVFAPAAARGAARGLVVATIRPTPTGEIDHGGDDGGDTERWRRADFTAAQHGIVLLEWFVVTDTGVALPRRSAGAPSRWPDGCRPGHRRGHR